MERDVLYIEEHLACRHYVSDERYLFDIVDHEPGTHFVFGELSENVIVFIIDGKLKFNCDDFIDVPFTRNQMIFVAKTNSASFTTLTNCRLLCCRFSVLNNVCDKLNLRAYWKICNESKYVFKGLEIRKQLDEFINSLEYYLEQGIKCEHYHEMKAKELFLILRWFYTREELALFLYPIIGDSLDFKALIMENYLKVENVDQLAKMAGMSRSNFDAAFRKEFDMSPGKWILKQTAKHVRYQLAEPGASISNVMLKFNFNSATHFTRFCKQQFGHTPTEMINILKDDTAPLSN